MFKYYGKYAPYLFLFPAAVVLVIFFFIPFFQTFILSFQDYSNSIYLTEKERSSYKNLVLPQGAEISVDDDDMGDEWKLEITLTPSEIIASTDYMQHYKY